MRVQIASHIYMNICLRRFGVFGSLGVFGIFGAIRVSPNSLIVPAVCLQASACRFNLVYILSKRLLRLTLDVVLNV